MEDILDSPLKDKIKFRKVDFLPPLLVLFLFIWSLWIESTGGPLLNTLDYFAFTIVLICCAIYFISRKIYMYTLAILFFMGTLNFFGFTPYHWYHSLGISFGDSDFKISIGLQLVSALLLVIHLLIFVKDFDRVSIKNQMEKKDESSQEVNSFKLKFKDKSIPELLEVAKGNGYRAEAIIAAKELLKENATKTVANTG